MALDTLCSDIDSFLNSLGNTFPELLGDTAARLLQDAGTALTDTTMVVLYGNSPPVLYRYMYQLYGVGRIRDDVTTIGDDEISYSYSDNHTEVPMTAPHMQYIRGIVKNKNIGNKRFVFLIKGCTIANRGLQASFKRLFERQSNAVFVFAARSLSCIAPEIVNMSMCIKCNFPKEKVGAFCKKVYNEDTSKAIEVYEAFNHDIVNTILSIKNGIEKTLLQAAFEKFYDGLAKEKNGLGIATACREFAHRLFHTNMPFGMLVAYVIRTLRSRGAKEAAISSVVECAARCDHLASISKKTILLYERFLLDVSQIA